MPVKRKVISRRKKVARKSSSFDFISFLRKNFLLVVILVLIPVTVLALSNDNLSNLIKAAGGRNMFRTQDRGNLRTLGGVANDGKNCEGKCYDPNLPDECLSANIGRNSQGKCYNCSTPISFKDTDNDGINDSFVSDTNVYNYNESYCTPYVTPIPAPTGAPIISVEVANCTSCVRRYDYPPYGAFDSSSTSKDKVEYFTGTDCDAAIKTKPGCTGGSPAPRDTYPTAVRPQSTAAPSNSNQTCNPGEWEAPKNCGKRGCSPNESARCKDDGSGWYCVGNPALCG